MAASSLPPAGVPVALDAGPAGRPASPHRAATGRRPQDAARATVPKADRGAPDPACLDDVAVCALIFPRRPETGRGVVPPPSWRAWRLPTTSLNVDRAIEELMRGDYGAKFRPELLEDFGHPCPYFAARLGVIHAARAGRHEVELHAAADRMRVAEIAVQKAAAQLATLLRNLPEDVERTTTPLDRRPDPLADPAGAEDRRAAAAQRRGLYTATAAALDVEREVLTGALARAVPQGPHGAKRGPKPQHWRLAFAQHLAGMWFLFTGEMPGNAELSSFQHLVSAAWLDLGGRSDVQWRSVVEGATTRAASWEAWNGIDWMVNGVLPADVDPPRRYATAAAARAQLTPRHAAHLRLNRRGDPATLGELLSCRLAFAEITAGDMRSSFPEVMALGRRLSALERKHHGEITAGTTGAGHYIALPPSREQ